RNDTYAPLLAKLQNELRFVLLTSKAEVKPLADADVAEGEVKGFAVKVVRSANHKCPRCWHYSDSKDAESLCSRCDENVNGQGEVRQFA
ncbi:isoleucyl-tRNA synthetase, partial [Pasteurella multocida subsp. multocida str. Anand1_buffalo]